MRAKVEVGLVAAGSTVVNAEAESDFCLVVERAES